MSVHGAKGKFIEYWGRGETGPIAFQKEFDTKIYWPRLKELTKKYNIEYAPGKVVPTDDDELDAIWQAGKELLLDVGILNVSTERRITFTEDELDEALENLPTEVTLGEGKDSITIPHRGFEDYDSGRTTTADARRWGPWGASSARFPTTSMRKSRCPTPRSR